VSIRIRNLYFTFLFVARNKMCVLFNYDFNVMGTFERGHEFNLILGWCDDKYFRRFGALRESHLDVLHKGATYEGSGMPDTRRDLFSLSTTTGPLAATVRENINSIRTSSAGDCKCSDHDFTFRYRRARQFALFVCYSPSFISISFYAKYRSCILYVMYRFTWKKRKTTR